MAAKAGWRGNFFLAGLSFEALPGEVGFSTGSEIAGSLPVLRHHPRRLGKAWNSGVDTVMLR